MVEGLPVVLICVIPERSPECSQVKGTSNPASRIHTHREWGTENLSCHCSGLKPVIGSMFVWRHW